MIKEVVDRIVNWTLNLFKEKPHGAIALIGVPAIILFLIVTEIGAPWSFSSGDYLTAVDLKASVSNTDSSTREEQGIILIVEPDTNDFRIDWTDGRPERFLVSVDEKTLSATSIHLKYSYTASRPFLWIFWFLSHFSWPTVQ